MSNSLKSLAILTTSILVIACNNKYDMGSFGYDKEYFKQKGIETIILTGNGGNAKVMVIPAYQGRVMTSTAAGDHGNSYGWINYKLIDSGEVNPQFNPLGGEERFWLGPEGGPFSYYFKKGEEQIYENWKVPAVIDTETYEVSELTSEKVRFTADAELVNSSGNLFNIGIDRSIEIMEGGEISKILGAEIPAGIKSVGYKSVNTIKNNGSEAWDMNTGMPSIWMLCTFNPTVTTTVFIPYNKDGEGRIVNDEYFGKVPDDRLVLDDGMLYFRIDGLCRTKIGLPDGRAKDICGSYDSEKKVLTILKYTIPSEKKPYVNSQWGEQDDPFAGDVINSYNDGPTETGTVMGPFYEIETSSAAADLFPGQSLTHEEFIFHFEGDENKLNEILKKVFGIELSKVSTMFHNDNL